MGIVKGRYSLENGNKGTEESMRWVEHGWVVSTVAKCVDTGWTGKNRAARDRKNILPHETPRERFQQGEDKERAESMTNRNIREIPQPAPTNSTGQTSREGFSAQQKSHIPCWIHQEKHLQISLLSHFGRDNLNYLVFFQEHPEILGISATLPLFQIFPGQIFAALHHLFLPSTFCTWG